MVKNRRCAPTAYAIAQGAWTSDDYVTTDGNASTEWWLRSPGNHTRSAAFMQATGFVDSYGYGVMSENTCVRPAMAINLK